MSRDLTDTQWAVLQPLVPAPKRTGRPRADDRWTFHGICYVLSTGCRWSDLPPRYGSPATCHRRLSQWRGNGTWLRVWETLLVIRSRQDKLRLEHAILEASPVPAKTGALRSAQRVSAVSTEPRAP